MVILNRMINHNVSEVIKKFFNSLIFNKDFTLAISSSRERSRKSFSQLIPFGIIYRFRI